MKLIKPGSVSGSIIAPSSKSDFQRAMAAMYLAARSGNYGKVMNPSSCDDAVACLNVVKNLGLVFDVSKDRVTINNYSGIKSRDLNCSEAGLSLRMFSAIAALNREVITLNGEGSLLGRPVAMIESPLRGLGVEVTSNEGLLPVEIKGTIKAGTVEVDASKTSQFLTGLIMALPLCEGGRGD